MLQVIKYYLMFSNRYLWLVSIYAGLHILQFIFGNDAPRPSADLLFVFLALPFSDMFLGVVKLGKIKFVFNELPLSFAKINLAKMTTIYIYILTYFGISILSAFFQDYSIESIIAEMMELSSYCIILISLLNRLGFVLDQYKHTKIINIAYLLTAGAFFYNIYPCSCELYNYIGISYGTWDTTLLNFGIMLVFTASELIMQYANRNRIKYVGQTKLF